MYIATTLSADLETMTWIEMLRSKKDALSIIMLHVCMSNLLNAWSKTEFIRDNVTVNNQIIFLSKVLHYYAEDVAVELPVLIEMVCKSMPEA
jgi:hypothetical protein